MSAERAGVYKTDPRAYRAGLAAVGNLTPCEVLFVAGSPHDGPGAGAVGMPVYWSNRFADPVPSGAPMPLRNELNLFVLPDFLAAVRFEGSDRLLWAALPNCLPSANAFSERTQLSTLADLTSLALSGDVRSRSA